MKNSLLVVVVLLGLLGQRQYVNSEQEYVVTADALTQMDGDFENVIDFSNLEVIGRERYINGTLGILKDLHDVDYGFTVAMYISPSGDGNYKKLAMDVPNTQVCEGFKKFYKEFVQPSFVYGENCNIPYIDDEGLCPIPAGEYYIKNIELNTDNWPNQIPRGTLKVVIIFYKGQIKVGGLEALLKIEDNTR